MKGQVAHLVLLLLLPTLFHGAQCDVAKYKRTVKGRLLGQNVNNPSQLLPVPKGSARVDCNATVTYRTPAKQMITRVLKTTEFLSTGAGVGAGGKLSASLTFTDNDFAKNDKVASFQVKCVITAGEEAEIKKEVTASGNAVINIGNVVAYWTVPLQVKGSLACAGSSKPISSVKATAFCTIEFNPTTVNTYSIVVFINTRKNGSFSSSALAYFGPDKVPLTGSFGGTKMTCVVDGPPDGTTVAQAAKPVVTNTGNYDFGTVLLQDNTPTKKFCKP